MYWYIEVHFNCVYLGSQMTQMNYKINFADYDFSNRIAF